MLASLRAEWTWRVGNMFPFVFSRNIFVLFLIFVPAGLLTNSQAIILQEATTLIQLLS